MDFLFDFIASVLAFFYDITGSYGAAIMLLTLAVMVAVTPLTLKGTRSMVAMQRLQPEMRKLQVKYKDDRQKLNEEMMAFYKEHNINPVGGCVPLLVQAPVFIVLYRVLNGMTQQPSWGYEMGASAGFYMRNPDAGGLNSTFGTFDPGYLDHTSTLYQSLDLSREMTWWRLNLADSFSQVLGADGVVAALPYLALVLVIGLTAWYQQRQIQARNVNASQINPQQQALMKIMPFFLPIVSLTLPAGLTLYFLVSNLYRIGQQAFITRTMYAEEMKKAKEAKEAKAKNGKGSGAKGGKGGGAKGSADVPSRKDTVPTGSKSILGGFVQLPARSSKGGDDADEGAAPEGAKGSGGKGSGGKGSANGSTRTATKATSPSRAAPSPRQGNQNRSKKKKPRR